MDPALLALAGRILVGVIFVVVGVRLLMARSAVASLLATKKVPQPAFVALAGGSIEIVLGALAVTGIATRLVALAMIVFVVAATVMVHDFWNIQGSRRALEVNTVLTHGLVVAGLLIMAAYPW
ncbi:MAG: DoxX family protein [Rhizobiales bacterium]|nr:DoxX family protein [Hyphomicrobiales bacterium]